jgi:hypothetical protein
MDSSMFVSISSRESSPEQPATALATTVAPRAGIGDGCCVVSYI